MKALPGSAPIGVITHPNWSTMAIPIIQWRYGAPSKPSAPAFSINFRTANGVEVIAGTI